MFFSNGKLILNNFGESLKKKLSDFMEVAMEAELTYHDSIRPSHFLLALVKIKNGYTQQKLKNKGINPEILSSSIRREISKPEPEGGIPDIKLTESCFSPQSLKIFQYLEEKILRDPETAIIEEPHLLLAVLENLEAGTAKILSYGNIKSDALIREVENETTTPLQVSIFDKKTGEVLKERFNQIGQEILERMKTLTEKMGYPKANPVVLIMALLDTRNGITQKALLVQRKNPGRILEQFQINVGGESEAKSEIALNKKYLRQSLVRILEASSREAARDQAEKIGESQLLRGYIQEDKGIAKNILQELGVNLEEMRNFAVDNKDMVPEEDKEKFEKISLEEVEQLLMKRVIGQEEAIGRIMPWIRRWRFGFPGKDKPAGVFLFLGSSGVGKTELAKAIARVVYGTEERFLFIEMNQLTQEHHVSKLIGAAPEYVGFDPEGGMLTKWMKDEPESVILFDEVEKAHPKVFDVLMRLTSEGKIQDVLGRVIDGAKCLLVLTSNIGQKERTWAELSEERDDLSSEALDKRVREKLLHFFRPEFIKRIDEIILFNDLTIEDFEKITEMQLGQESERMQEHKGIEFRYTHRVVEQIAGISYGKDEGARAVARDITRLIVDPAIKLLTREEDKDIKGILFSWQEDRIELKPLLP